MFGSNVFKVPPNATNTIYVEGLPTDATEREVSHIFRPFRGYKSVRLIPRDKGPEGKVLFCFADFENTFQTTVVINTLQGYRLDKDDIWGLQFSYAKGQYSGGKNAVKEEKLLKENASEPSIAIDRDDRLTTKTNGEQSTPVAPG